MRKTDTNVNAERKFHYENYFNTLLFNEYDFVTKFQKMTSRLERKLFHAIVRSKRIYFNLNCRKKIKKLTGDVLQQIRTFVKTLWGKTKYILSLVKIFELHFKVLKY